jgi:SAM-dependent methyltransferase
MDIPCVFVAQREKMYLMNETTNFRSAKEFVGFGVREKEQGRRESISGPGSSLRATADTRKFLRDCLRELNVLSILDLGCGDWNWMREVELINGEGEPVQYQGWDADEALVANLNRAYGSDTCRFLCADIITEEYPQVDLIIARDVLFHLPLELATTVVDRARKTARYMLSTSFLGVTQNDDIQQYNDIVGWGFHKINLNAHPINLTEYMKAAFREDGNAHSGNERYICLYV